ncbi:MAG: fhlA [Hyphomicrobiales bacterium]|nr:fhlA [Hyphomicrobiales bacterium]
MPLTAKLRRSSHTARWHLAVFAMALSLPVLTFVGYLLFQYTQSERNRLEGRAATLANDVSVSVDRELTGLAAGLDVLSLSQFLQEGDLEGFYAQAKQVEERQGVIPVLRDVNGQQLVNTRLPFRQPLPVSHLSVDQKVLETKKPQISGLFIGAVTNAPLFGVVVPVLSGERVIYLLSLSLPLDRIRAVFDDQDIPQGWAVAVVDRQGTIMARNIRNDEFVGKSATRDLIEHTDGPSGTWGGTSVEGEAVFGAYSRSRLSDWRIAVGVRRDLLNQSLTQSFWLLMTLGAALLALSTVLAAFFARRITQPMHALSARAAALGRGEDVSPLETTLREADEVSEVLATASSRMRQRARERDKAVSALSEETLRLDTLNRAGTTLSGELDLEHLIESITTSATRLSGAQYGAFFERVPPGPLNEEEVWKLGSLSSADPEAFTRFGLPRATKLFAPSFRGEGVIRSDDVHLDPRYGSLGGMPAGHLPVRSYMAVPVISRSAETLGVLLFGHAEPGRFGEREERLIAGFAGQASIALDNARLFRSVQLEQDRFRAAVAAVRGVLWTNDAEGRMRGEQPGWSALTGQSRAEYQDYGWANAVHPDDTEASVAAWNEAVAKHKTFIFEHRVRRYDGVWRTFAIRAVPVIQADGSLREWVGVHTDITEQRDAEAELKESNEEIQRYAYIVSHDLRAPLVNIMGFTSELEAVREGIMSELASSPKVDTINRDLVEAISFIKAAINKMDSLINAILRLSREGRRTFRPENLDMKQTLQGLADAQRHQADAVEAEVIIGELPMLVADRLAVEQIFGNLIDNAIKYLAPGRPGRIEISGEQIGSRVRFGVRDNGRGISPQDHARVFELFRRSGAQDKPGEGIGLAHVRTLVRSLGGRIDLASSLGIGTTFIITMPQAPARTSTAALAAE